MTQPAASAALARLRRHFGDELLERTRTGFVLTPLGEQLAARIEPVCLGLEQLFSTEPAFRPAESDREFTILTTDYVLAAFGERLSRALHAAAPRARLHVRVLDGALPADLPESLRGIDGIVSAPKAEFKVAEIGGQELFRDRWVCVVDAGNPVADGWASPTWNGCPGSCPTTPTAGTRRARRWPRCWPGSRSARRWRCGWTATRPPRTSWPAPTGSRSCRSGWPAASPTAPTCGSWGAPATRRPIVEIFWWHVRHTEDAAHSWFRALLARAARPLAESAIHNGHAPHSNV